MQDVQAIPTVRQRQVLQAVQRPQLQLKAMCKSPGDKKSATRQVAVVSKGRNKEVTNEQDRII